MTGWVGASGVEQTVAAAVLVFVLLCCGALAWGRVRK